MLLKLAKVLDTTPHYLVHGEVPQPEESFVLNDTAQWRERALTAEKKLEALRGAAGRLAELIQGSLPLSTKVEPEPELTDAQKALKVAEQMVDEKMRKEAAASSGKSPEDVAAEAAETFAAEARHKHPHVSPHSRKSK